MQVAVVVVAAVFGIVASIWLLRVRRREETIAAPCAPESASRPLGELLARYRLVERDTAFFGRWRETEVRGVRVGFVVRDAVQAHAGAFDPDEEQISAIYLARVSPGRPLPRDGSPQRLDRFLGVAGRSLAAQYYLCATGAPGYPALDIPEVRHALLALSPSVTEVAFYESGGVQLRIEPQDARASTVESDVERAVELARTLREQLSALAVSA